MASAHSLIRIAVLGTASGFLFCAPAAADTFADMTRLMRSAFFSDACREAAEKMQIRFPHKPHAVIAAFKREISTLTPDTRAELGVSLMGTAAFAADCNAATILLINVLRENGIAAELVLTGPPAGRQTGVLLYVPDLDRYIDPAAPPDAARETNQRARSMERAHIVGPSLTPLKVDPCARACLKEFRRPLVDAIRVRTIRIAPKP